jgi:hypothetical protein
MPKPESPNRILKDAREKCQLTYKDKCMKITSDCSKEWSNIIQALRENNCQSRILYLAKLSFNPSGEIRTL